MSSQSGKDVIYIDIDDEITAIIDKVRGADQRIVALVLPKRATAFQSIVNMKLLKRTADDAKKHLVLITSEAGLLPLAGAVGVYVAKTLQSKPEIPAGPAGGHGVPEDDEESVDMKDDSDAKLDRSRPIGEYTGAAAGAQAAMPADDDDDAPVEFDNAAPAAAATTAGKAKAAKKDRKLKIPDFNKFRTWAILGSVGLIVLIFFWYIGFVVMPRASITVKTDSTAVETNIDLTFDIEAEDVDVDEGVVPAKKQEVQKTASQQVAATGQKDKGEKAAGPVNMSAGACSATAPSDVPAGTGVTTNSLTYITQGRVSFVPSFKNGKCTWVASSSVQAVAQNGGEKYNIASSSLSVAGRSDVSASTTGMSGGTTEIVKVIAQADIDSAKQKIAEQDNKPVKTELAQALSGQGLYAIEDSLTNTDPEVTTSAQVGDEAENVTVTQKTTYSMLGAKEADLKRIIANEVNKEIDPQKQEILDHGIADASFRLQNQQGSSTLLTLSATSIAGSALDLSKIKEQVAGKKANDAKELIGDYPGVTSVDVHYSPFWVSSIPKKESKITITVEKPAVKNAR